MSINALSALATQLSQPHPGSAPSWDIIEAAVEVLKNAFAAGAGGGILIPASDSVTYTYFGSTNNIQTAVYKLGDTTVRTLTFTYVNSGVANDDNIASITGS